MIGHLFLLAQQLTPVVPIVPPGTPALPVQETNQLLSQITSAALTVYAIKLVKGQAWYQAMMPNGVAGAKARKMISRALSSAGALIGAVGIHYAFHAVAGEDGTYVLTVSGITFSSMFHGAWHFANQLALQQISYDAVVKPTTPPIPAAGAQP